MLDVHTITERNLFHALLTSTVHTVLTANLFYVCMPGAGSIEFGVSVLYVLHP